MTATVADFVGARRDSIRERALARELRALPEAERFEFIRELLETNASYGLVMVRRCLRRPEHARILITCALRTADASSIRCWLEALVPKLGFRQTMQLLDEHLESDLAGVSKARYWLPLFRDTQGYDPTLIQRLDVELKARGMP